MIFESSLKFWRDLLFKAAASPVAMLAISSALLALGIVQVGTGCMQFVAGSLPLYIYVDSALRVRVG